MDNYQPNILQDSPTCESVVGDSGSTGPVCWGPRRSDCASSRYWPAVIVREVETEIETEIATKAEAKAKREGENRSE